MVVVGYRWGLFPDQRVVRVNRKPVTSANNRQTVGGIILPLKIGIEHIGIDILPS